MSCRMISRLILIIVGCLLSQSEAAKKRPHIVLIIADDLGWNDVGYRDPTMHTPNIDRMAAEGVTLKYSYMNQVCSPSRAALMTGIYPYKLGLQNSVFAALKNDSLPLQYKILPQHLKGLGYATHYIGKWHLGFCNHAMTPTHRGFDTFYGMYTGKAGYYNHTSKWDGYDLHDDVGQEFRVAWEGNGTYSTHLFTDRAKEIIEQHDKTNPLFLVVSYQAVHGPLEVPDEYVTNFCANVTSSEERKLHCAMTAAMDEGIGIINETLYQNGYYDNVITLFTSDNGGPVKLGSSNWPLRGSKITLWEGGTRVVSILHSKTHLSEAPYEFTGLMHAVDWYPTLVRAAGDKDAIEGIDGVDNWKKIVKNRKNSKRDGFVYNIDDVKNTSAIRYGKYKLIHNKPGSPDGWYNPPANIPAPDKPSGKYPEYMLFNIDKDPAEENDLSNSTRDNHVSTFKTMKELLANYTTSLVPSVEANRVDEGKPKHHNYSWVSGWC